MMQRTFKYTFLISSGIYKVIKEMLGVIVLPKFSVTTHRVVALGNFLLQTPQGLKAKLHLFEG